MPKPRPNESRDDYLERCIPQVLADGTAKDQDQAVAICSQMWRDKGYWAGDTRKPLLPTHSDKNVPVPMAINRAYSILEIRSYDGEQRSIEGVATTPTPDRMGDIVDPMGAKFSVPMPLLWQHDAKHPVGHVVAAKSGRNGIKFRATIAKISEDGDLKRMCDMAWQAVKAKLVRGVSIGFRPSRDGIEQLKDGGLRFKLWEWLELSLVTIPANADCTIATIKSYALAERASLETLRAASGQDRKTTAPGVPGHKHGSVGNQGQSCPPGIEGRTKMLNLDQQISNLENSRAAKAARMEAIASKATDEGRSMDGDEAEEFDDLTQEMKDIDADLRRFRALEKARQTAKEVNGEDTRKAASTRSGISVKMGADLPKGTRFARYAMAIAAGKGSMSDSIAYAERWRGQTPEVIDFIKANPGTSVVDDTSPVTAWGGELVYPTNIAAEFVELLRPATVLGKLDGVRRVPFNIRVPVQTGGATVAWVGEGAPKPVSEEAFSTITLGYHKVAGIVVLTEELVRLSSPSAEEVVRRDLVEQIAKFMDEQFLSPAVAAVVGVNPASVTNGVNPFGASGTEAIDLREDLNRALAPYDTANLGTGGLAILMPPAVARGISAMTNLVGGAEFAVTPTGGTLLGFQVIVSSSVPASTIILIKADEILVADDGAVRLDASNQATLNMTSVSPDSTAGFNLWQRNAIGLRAERWITWAKRRATAVQMINSASYGPGTSP